MITLGVETSCDETAIGVIEDGKVLANIVSSQIAHSKFGGVVPELAARNHIKVIMPLTKIALEVADKSLEQIDLISVTRGPGLIEYPRIVRYAGSTNYQVPGSFERSQQVFDTG